MISMYQLSRAVARAMHGARRSPLIQGVAVSTIGLSLVLVGVFALAATNAARLARVWGGAAQLTVYLEDGTTAARQKQIGEALRKLAGVSQVRIVDQHEAHERLRRSLGGRGELLDGVEEGFLPASIEVALKPGVAEMLRAHPAFARLQKAPGVESVDLSDDWAERLRAVQRLLVSLGLAVGLLVACACLYIVASTIRLGVHSRRDELEILKLVGATDGFVKAPFLVEGALQGALGTLVATGILFVLFRAAAPRIEAVLGTLMAAHSLAFFGPGQIVLATASGALLGLCGSALALGRYVRV